ncbi:MAG: glycosyltransferase family 2 protein [Pikeienuella sp.]
MNNPGVSVVILTRNRPREFATLLQALTLQRHQGFEVVVVGAAATAAEQGAPAHLANRLTYIQCLPENVSMARNIGIGHAHGQIIAFIDDDAAPEPDWLDHLIRPFDDPKVAAVGGFVRGRNGVDFQWRGALIDRYGAHSELTSDDFRNPELGLEAGEHFVSIVGVNCAFRRSILQDLGGFDENFQYFLDESDICIRLQRAGWRTALAPKAEVYHAYAESAERSRNRAPRDLFQIAASRVYFARTYGEAEHYEERLDQFQVDQKTRLRKFIQLGRLSRRQARWIEQRMAEGLIEGEARFTASDGAALASIPSPPQTPAIPFVPTGAPRRLRVAIVIITSARKQLRRAAEILAEAGCEVTVFDFDFSAKRLKVGFHNGIWLHHGGIIGRDTIDAPLPSPRRCIRVRAEMDRIGDHRDFEVFLRPDLEKYRIKGLQPIFLSGTLKKYVAEPFRLGAGQELATLLSTNPEFA